MAPIEQVQRNAVPFAVDINEDEAVFEAPERSRESPALGARNQPEFRAVSGEAREVRLALNRTLDARTRYFESVRG